MTIADQIIDHGPYALGVPLPDSLVKAGLVLLPAEDLNALRSELIAGRRDRARYPIYVAPWGNDGGTVGILHDGCPSRWYVELADFTALAELVQRADEHAEVCR